MDYDRDDFLKRMEEKEKEKQQAILDSIQKAQDRMAKKDETINELTFERELLFNNLLSILNTDLAQSSFNIFRGWDYELFRRAWKWARYKKDPTCEVIENKEKEDYESAFNLTVSAVKEKFFGDLKDQVEFKELIMFWTVGYEYVYTYNGQEISIIIPTFNADKENYQHVLQGYIVNYRESEHSCAYISSGLDAKKAAKELQGWIRNEGWKK